MADNELSYDHLAAGLKEALQNDKSAFDSDRLQKYTGTKFTIGITSLNVLFCLIIIKYLSSRVFFL